MKKIIVIIFLSIITIFSNAQDFLYNSDYIYGMGQTDSAAVASLSISIGVNFENKVSYSVIEENSQISQKYVKNSSLNYSRFIEGTKTYYDNGIFYRYLNKREYIDNNISLCKKYERNAELIDTKVVKHGKNIILGYYYKAYEMLNEPLFIALTKGEYESWKQTLKNKAKIVYCSGEYGVFFIQEESFNGYWLESNISSKTMGIPVCLPAIEYQNNGEWVLPSYYDSYENNVKSKYSYPNDGINFNRCFVITKSKNIAYRFLYEDEYGKINVPEDWYFFIYRVMI